MADYQFGYFSSSIITKANLSIGILLANEGKNLSNLKV